MLRSALLFFLLLVGCGSAGAAPPPTDVATAGGESESSAQFLNLWEIRAPNGAVDHVLGTYHFGITLEEALPERHVEVLDGARIVLGEIDLLRVDMAAASASMLLPPGGDLQTMLAPELWAPLVDAVGATVPELVLHRLRPIAAMVLVMAGEASREQAERAAARHGSTNGAPESSAPEAPVPGLDAAVFQHAADHGVATAGLETMELQLALLGAIPTSEIEPYLRASLLPSASGGASGGLVERTTQAFVDGDLEPIWREIEREATRSPAFFETFLFARNDAWLTPLMAELDRGRAFVAVGLGHLLGDRGLLAMLAARGYTVTRVRR